MQYSVHAARAQLSKLIDAALAGEEVVIARGSRPMVRLEPITQSGFRFGLLAGKVGSVPDFFEPLAPEDLELWEGG
jgi:antitoxin (DNA-binding transcriptional repressor) of toxin-antitoxin stability system